VAEAIRLIVNSVYARQVASHRVPRLISHLNLSYSSIVSSLTSFPNAMSEVQLVFAILSGVVLWFLLIHILAWMRYTHTRPARLRSYDARGGYGAV